MNATPSRIPFMLAAAAALAALLLEEVLADDAQLAGVTIGPVLFAVFVAGVLTLIGLSVTALLRRRTRA